MKKIIRGLFLGSTGIFALSLAFIGSLGVLAYQREYQHDLQALLFLSQFPRQQPNEAAQDLDNLLIALDLPPVISKQSIKLQDPQSVALWREVFVYIQVQAKRTQGPLDPLPASIQQYLTVNNSALAKVETLLLSDPQPRWGINLEAVADFGVQQPMFVGAVNLHRLLLLRSFVADSQGDSIQANHSLLAAWRLTQAMANRPDSTSQLASTIQVNNQLAFLRYLKSVSPDWRLRIADKNYQSMMEQSLQFDGWMTYKGLQNAFTFNPNSQRSHPLTTSLPESYMRLSAVNMSEQLNDYFHSLTLQNPCEFEPHEAEATVAWWNHLALLGLPKSIRQWQRAGETMLAAELTQLVLQAKNTAARQGHWPETLPALASQICIGSRWQYQVNRDNSLSINFQGPTTWRNIYNSGSSLSFNASAWDFR